MFPNQLKVFTEQTMANPFNSFNA